MKHRLKFLNVYSKIFGEVYMVMDARACELGFDFGILPMTTECQYSSISSSVTFPVAFLIQKHELHLLWMEFVFVAMQLERGVLYKLWPSNRNWCAQHRWNVVMNCGHEMLLLCCSQIAHYFAVWYISIY